MTKYAVSEEGVRALNAMAAAVVDAVERIESAGKTVQTTADEYENTLGPHKKSLDKALDNIASRLREAGTSAEEAASKLKETAQGYQDIINDDKLGG